MRKGAGLCCIVLQYHSTVLSTVYSTMEVVLVVVPVDYCAHRTTAAAVRAPVCSALLPPPHCSVALTIATLFYQQLSSIFYSAPQIL